jgi:acetyl-CoA C-acetyltransferase
MRKVGIVAYGTSKFTKRLKEPFFELACRPCFDILAKNTGFPRNNIEGVIFSSCCDEQYSSAILSEMLGLKPKISYRLDNLCNSGTNAVVSGFALISSGLCDSVLVVGAETTSTAGRSLSWDITRGWYTLPIYWAALFAKSHMRQYGTTEEQLAMVSVKNHKNAAQNPTALYSKEVTLDEVMNSKKIADPLKVLDCSSVCNGSSALLLLSEEKVKNFTDTPVWIKGIGQQTNSASLSEVMKDLSVVGTARKAAREAYRMSGITPSKIDVAELHDAFTIMEIMAYEDLEFVQKGLGGKFVQQKEIGTNLRGGILGCGHPLGATGVAQVAEITAQLLGKTKKRQSSDCEVGLVHNLAAAGTSATVVALGV